MPYYHTLGKIPKKRHIAFRKPDGGLYAEQLVGHEGFTGTSALPLSWKVIDSPASCDEELPR